MLYVATPHIYKDVGVSPAINKSCHKLQPNEDSYSNIHMYAEIGGANIRVARPGQSPQKGQIHYNFFII